LDSYLNLYNIDGNVSKTPNIAIIIANDVNNPNRIVGIKFDKLNTEKPKAIVNEVVKTAFPTLL
tara:strand:+ start:282 stop:473 length:192 start_codon:yes stop_codon:yes gene_type:complete